MSWGWASVRARGRAVRLDVEVLKPLCGSLDIASPVLASRHRIPGRSTIAEVRRGQRTGLEARDKLLGVATA